MRLKVWMMVGVLLLASVSAVNAQETGQIPAQASAGCANATYLNAAEVVEYELEFDGETRGYLLYIPEIADTNTPAPLVLSLHGFASNPEQQMNMSRWNEIADTEGLIAVYPRGTGFPLRWNTGYSNPRFRDPNVEGADDVGYIDALLNELGETLCIDIARVYVTGLSNGGGMSHQLACELADRITAIGTVAGAYNPLEIDCEPARPIPVISYHGTDDPIVPYTGDGDFLPDIEAWAAQWADRNGCAQEPEAIPPNDDIRGVRYTDCDDSATVILYTVEGGGHTIPGAEPLPRFIVGTTTQTVIASDVMWDFFAGYALGG